MDPVRDALVKVRNQIADLLDAADEAVRAYDRATEDPLPIDMATGEPWDRDKFRRLAEQRRAQRAS